MVAKGKTEKAEEALCWLRGWVDPETVKHEFLDLVRYNEVSGFRGAKTDTNAGDENFLSKLAQFKDPSVYRPLKLMMIFFFIAYISSIFHTRPFITKIMSEVDIVNYQNESLVRKIFRHRRYYQVIPDPSVYVLQFEGTTRRHLVTSAD